MEQHPGDHQLDVTCGLAFEPERGRATVRPTQVYRHHRFGRGWHLTFDLTREWWRTACRPGKPITVVLD